MEQIVSAENNWLYIDMNNNRLFAKKVQLPANAPIWDECTEAEKLAWEEAHKEAEPTEEVTN